MKMPKSQKYTRNILLKLFLNYVSINQLRKSALLNYARKPTSTSPPFMSTIMTFMI